MGRLRKVSGEWRYLAVDPAAFFWARLERLAAAQAIDVEFGSDNLDSYMSVQVELPSSGRVLLRQYPGSPAPGTEVYVRPQDDARAVCLELAEILDLPEKAIVWPPFTDATFPGWSD